MAGTVFPGLFNLIIFFVIASLVTGETTSILARSEHNVLEGVSALDGFFSGGAPHETEEMTSFFLEIQKILSFFVI